MGKAPSANAHSPDQTSPRLKLPRRPSVRFGGRAATTRDVNGWTTSPVGEQDAPVIAPKSSPQRFSARREHDRTSGTAASTVPNFSLRDIGAPSTSPAAARELLPGQRRPGRSSFRASTRAEEGGCCSATGGGQDDLPVLCEDMVSAYTTMRGPRPVDQPDPLLSLLLARSKAQTNGTTSSASVAASATATSSATTSSAVPGTCFSLDKQSSPYQTTLITPVDDDCSVLSSQPTVMYNILRSPRKSSQTREPLIGIHAPEVRFKFEGDPWKCKPFEDTLAGKMPRGTKHGSLSGGPAPASGSSMPIEASQPLTSWDQPPDLAQPTADSSTDAPKLMREPIMSPSDFLVLAEGAQAWRTDELHREAMAGMPEPARMRPLDPSPKTPEPRPRFGDRWNPAGFQPQFDRDSGEPMSPHYKVPSSPSILWSPRPVTPEMMYRHFPHGEFDRMDAAAGEACREACLGRIPSFGSGGACSDQSPYPELFAEDEIDEVLATHRGPIFDDIHPSSFRDAIDTMEEHLGLSRLEHERLERQNERQRQRLRALERLPSPPSPRPGGAATQGGLSPRRSRDRHGGHDDAVEQQPGRRARVLRHMAGRLRDNLWAHHCLQEALGAARREHASLRLHIDRLERHIRPAAAGYLESAGGCYDDDDFF
ncbi:hypothetical protein RB594_004333 [Gaeumannomyces avenae]